MSREISATGWNSTSSRQVKFRSMENFEVLSGNNKISRTTSGNWRFSNFLFFAFQILKKTSRGLDLRETKQYLSPKPLHHIHNSFWRPNEPNGRECAVPGGALHDITRGPEGHSFQLVSVTTHQKDFGVARKIPEVRWGREINAGTVFEMFLYCFPHIFDTNFQEQTFRNDFRLTVALLRMQVTCWSLREHSCSKSGNMKLRPVGSLQRFVLVPSERSSISPPKQPHIFQKIIFEI